MNDDRIQLNETNFEQEVLEALTPVLVEFWASWSRSCKAMAHVLQAIAKDEAMPLKLARVNVERQEELVEQYGVRAVPTVLIFNRGGLYDRVIGRITEQELREKLEGLK